MAIQKQRLSAASRAEIWATLRLAWPVVLTQLAMMAMGFVDTLFVGPLGPAPLAGTSIANSVYFSVIVFFMGPLIALDPLVAQAVGRGAPAEGGAWFWQGAWFALAAGVALNLLFFDAEWIFLALGQTPEVASEATRYLGARSFSAVPFLAFQALRGLFNGVGQVRAILGVMAVANLLNLGLDAVLIHGAFGLPALGVVGAGLATTGVRWASLGVLAWMAARSLPSSLSLRVGPVLPEKLRRLIAVGLPIGGQTFVEVAFFGAGGVMAGWLGAEALAAHQIALSLASFTFMVPMGLSIAASVRVGQAVGAGELDRAALSGRVSLGLGAAFMGAAAALMMLAPAALARLFSPGAEVLALATELVVIAGLFQIADGVQGVAQGVLRGVGEVREPFWAAFFAHWIVGLPLAYVLAFPLGLGAPGVWWGMLGALLAASTFLCTIFFRERWRDRPLLAGGG